MRAFITGGTGTLGRELARQLIARGDDVTIFSRDELKQKEMAAEYSDVTGLHFVIGDVRDADSVRGALRGVHGAPAVVFHAAALKHVDTAEANPEECLKTNLLATQVVAKECMRAGVPHVAFSSTDKAVDPINFYGLCKAASERLLFHYNATQAITRFSVFRWGNILGSRGSIVEPFVKSLLSRGEVGLTDPQMTRFWLKIEDAVRFMISNYAHAPRHTALIPEVMAAPVSALARAIADELGVTYRERIVGIRPGEKIHEALISLHHDDHVNSRTADQYTEDELRVLVRPLVRKYLSVGSPECVG